MFMLDLDELDTISSRLWLVSRNRFNFFSFSDKHHAKFPGQKTPESASAKTKITEFLASQHHAYSGIGKIYLLTNLTTMGYIFNPVSFYYCFDRSGQPLCAVAEVCNTFGEMKLYHLGKETLSGDTFTFFTPKLFYVSPFTELDTAFNFILKVPSESLIARVDDYKNEKRFLLSALTGQRKALTDLRLLYYLILFPFITLKIITLIHWQALRLYFKKLPFIRKNENMHLQKDLIKL